MPVAADVLVCESSKRERTGRRQRLPPRSVAQNCRYAVAFAVDGKSGQLERKETTEVGKSLTWVTVVKLP